MVHHIVYYRCRGDKATNRKEVRAMDDHKKPSDLQIAVVAGVVAGLIVELIKTLTEMLINL